MKIDKKMVINSLIFNNRLKSYGEYIQYAKEKGYQVVSLEDFYRLKNRRYGKYFVLRHDVDSVSKATRKMYETERKLGVKSTYYFRFSTIDNALIRDMVNSGFDVGLHFETISDYAREYGIKDKKQIDLNFMKKRLKRDIRRFEKITGVKIYSCCSHGAVENSELGISNNAITENADMEEFGLGFEAYDKKLYEDVDCHIMDSCVIRNFGFSYKDNPISAIKGKKKNIVFLAHPGYWWMSAIRRGYYGYCLILGKGSLEIAKREFKRVME